jgi:diphthamide biosynthesis protein 2
VVGTLGVAGFLQAAEEVRRLARKAGKRTYTILMGKPSPAKLANFPEADIFVMIADAQVEATYHVPSNRTGLVSFMT